MVAGVCEAINMAADSFPEGCRNMLLAALPNCLLTPANERHDHQESLVKMIGEVLDSNQAGMQKRIDADNEKISEAEGTKSSHEAALTDASASLASRAEEKSSGESALEVASKAVDDAKTGLTEAREAQSKGDADLREAEGSKKVLSEVLAQNIGVLKEGEQEGEKAQRHLEAIMPLARQFKVDDALAAAISNALTKRPAERSGFDVMIINELETSMKNRVAELDATMAAGAPASAERAADVDRAQRRLDEATESRELRAAELSAAHAAHADAAAAVHEAEADLNSFSLGYELMVKDRDEKAAELDNYVNYHLLCFTTLRDTTAHAAPAGA